MARRLLTKYWPILSILGVAFLLWRATVYFAAIVLGEGQPALSPTEAENWFKYEFAEVKGIAQQFVTIVVGVLVFSITFSEKIVRYDAAHWSQRFFLTVCWCGCVLAIVGGGISVVLIMLAAAYVRYPGTGDYHVAQGTAFVVLFASGLTFVLSLISLLLSAVKTRDPVEEKAVPPPVADTEAETG